MAHAKKINRVVKSLILSDVVLLFGWGLIGPIFAVFILTNIKGGSALVAGVSAGIYWLLKSIIQIPVAKFLDKTNGEKDDFFALFFGILAASLVPLGYLFIKQPWHLYLLQSFYALCMAFVVPSWSGIFTRHAEKGREAFCWSLESSGLGIGTGAAGILGGILVKAIGFNLLFFFVFALTFISAFLLLFARNHLTKTKAKVYPLPKPR